MFALKELTSSFSRAQNDENITNAPRVWEKGPKLLIVLILYEKNAL